MHVATGAALQTPRDAPAGAACAEKSPQTSSAKGGGASPVWRTSVACCRSYRARPGCMRRGPAPATTSAALGWLVTGMLLKHTGPSASVNVVLPNSARDASHPERTARVAFIATVVLGTTPARRDR